MFRATKKTVTDFTADTSTGLTAQPPLVRPSGSPNTAPAAEVGGRGNPVWDTVHGLVVDILIPLLLVAGFVLAILAPWAGPTV